MMLLDEVVCTTQSVRLSVPGPGSAKQPRVTSTRMADVDDEEAELYGVSASSDVKLADSSIGNHDSSLDLDGLGEKDEDDEANDNAEDDDGCDIICLIAFLPASI
jgi:hypothetical protein